MSNGQNKKLAQAIDGGSLEKVKLAIKRGAKINKEYDSFYPLERAVLAGNIEIAKFLLQNNADINVNDRQILVYALRIINNNPIESNTGRTTETQVTEMVKLLIGWGADPNGVMKRKSDKRFDSAQRSALHRAIWHRYMQAIPLLLGAGASKTYHNCLKEDANRIALDHNQEALVLLNRSHPNSWGQERMQFQRQKLANSQWFKPDTLGSSSIVFVLALSIFAHTFYHKITEKNSDIPFNILYTLGTILFASAAYIFTKYVNHIFINPAAKIADNLVEISSQFVIFSKNGNDIVLKLSEETLQSIRNGREMAFELKDGMLELITKSGGMLKLVGEAFKEGQLKPEVIVEVKDNHVHIKKVEANLGLLNKLF